MVRGSDSVDEAIDIQRVLAGLTCKQRTAVELAMQGYSQVDIAGMLGIRQSSVHHRLRAAAHCINMASQRLVSSV